MSEFRFGIEEEYFIVHRRTASIMPRLSQPFMKAAKKKLGPNLMYELLQSQIEVATSPVGSPRDARQQLTHFRSTLADIGREYNVGIVAAGTHPLTVPHEQRMTPKRRYAVVAALGQAAMGQYGCAACHAIPGTQSPGGVAGPPLSGLADRLYIGGAAENTPDNLIRWIVNPKQFNASTAMPITGIDESEARDVAAFLYSR